MGMVMGCEFSKQMERQSMQFWGIMTRLIVHMSGPFLNRPLRNLDANPPMRHS